MNYNSYPQPGQNGFPYQQQSSLSSPSDVSPATATQQSPQAPSAVSPHYELPGHFPLQPPNSAVASPYQPQVQQALAAQTPNGSPQSQHTVPASVYQQPVTYNSPVGTFGYPASVLQQQHQQQQQQYYGQSPLTPQTVQGVQNVQPPLPPPPPRNLSIGGIEVNEKEMKAPAKSEDKRIWGIRRTTFWLILVSVLLLAGLVGAAAAAAVLSSERQDAVAEAEAAMATASQAMSAPSVSQSASSASSSSEEDEDDDDEDEISTSSTSNTKDDDDTTRSNMGMVSIPIPQQAGSGKGVANVTCPDSDGETFRVPGTTLEFTRECGVNYPFSDLGNIPMTNMEDCMMLCASQYVSPQASAGGCIGVVWGYEGRQGNGGSSCWLKYSKGEPDGDGDAKVETAWLRPLGG